MRGRLWKVAREQLRLATPEEELGAELVIELSKEMLTKLHKPGQLAFQDITGETFPQDDDFAGDEISRVLRISEEMPVQGLQQPLQDEDYTPELAPTETTMEPNAAAEMTPLETTPGASRVPSRRVSIQEEKDQDAPMEPVVEESTEPVPSLGTVRVDESSDGSFRFGPAPASASRSTARALPYRTVPQTPPPGYVPPPTYPFDGRTMSLPPPPPPGPSYYMEVIDFDKDDDLAKLGTRAPFIGATWRYDRERGRLALQPRVHGHGTFTGAQAEASFCPRDKCMYVSKAKSSFGQVEFSKLPEKMKVAFRKSRKKELDSLIANGAVKVLSVEESAAFMEMYPEQIIDSKFVDRFKPKEISLEALEQYKQRAIREGHLEACQLEEDQTNPKSRLCVVGWQDPQIMEVERSAPTPLSTSLYCCLQLAAARRWKTRVKDVKTAFLQALPTTRSKKLAIRQPNLLKD